MIDGLNQVGSRKLILELMKEFFPFHLIVDQHLEVIQIGRGISKLLSKDPSSKFFESFSIVGTTDRLTFNDFNDLPSGAVHVKVLCSNVILRTQLSIRANEGILIFAGTPKVSDSSIAKTLDIGDFAAYDTTPDYLFAYQALQSSFDEVLDLTNKLEDQKSHLIRINSELDKFTYVASHDLQSPLRTIVGFAQLLARELKGNDNTKVKEYLNFIKTAGQNMSSLIRGLLKYSRTSKGVPTLERVNLDTILREISENMRYAIEEENVTIEWSNLPEVYGDKLLLKQLLANLIDNAIKFNSKDAPEVKINGHDQEGFWKISVQDNGPGLEKEYEDSVFSLFQRGNYNDESGNGIGLSICKSIVEQHEGSITYSSKNEEGTTFYFTLKKPVDGFK